MPPYKRQLNATKYSYQNCTYIIFFKAKEKKNKPTNDANYTSSTGPKKEK